MTDRSPALYLSEILSSMDKIERYITGLSYDEFILHDETVDAVERNIEKIGEADAAIPDEVRNRHPEVPWKTIVGLRNKVIHHYFAVDHEVIWQIITKKISRRPRGRLPGYFSNIPGNGRLAKSCNARHVVVQTRIRI